MKYSSRHRYKIQGVWLSDQAGKRFYPDKLFLEKARLLEMLGQPGAAGEIYRKNIEAAGRMGVEGSTARSLTGLGGLLTDQGDYEGSLALLRQAEDINIRLDEKRGLADVYNKIAHVYGNKSDYQKTGEYLNRSLETAREMKDEAGVGIALVNLGVLEQEHGNFIAAREMMLKAWEISRRLDLLDLQINVASRTAWVLYSQGDLDGALREYQLSLTLSQRTGNKRVKGHALGNCGIIYWTRGQLKEAGDCFAQAAQIMKTCGDLANLAQAEGNMGLVYSDMGEISKARQCFDRQLEISEKLGNRSITALAAGNIGDIHYELGEYDRAGEWVNKQLAIGEEIGDKLLISHSWYMLGNISKNEGRGPSALELYCRAVDLAQSTGLEYYLCNYLCARAWLHHNTGSLQEAGNDAARARELSGKVQNKDAAFESRLLLALLKADEQKETALGEMLGLKEQVVKEQQKARLFHELFKMTGDQEYRKEAVGIYQGIWEKTRNAECRKHLAELR